MRNKICYVLIALWAACAVPQSVAEKVKPNVVLILIDDLGWQDVKCYDIDKPSPMETPNIDALAKKAFCFGRLIHLRPSVRPVVRRS